MSINNQIIQWLNDFEECVRDGDFERGRVMFHEDCFCFGSKASMLVNRDELIENQWKEIWNNISDFQYDLNTLQIVESKDLSVVCAMCMWSSKGYSENREAFFRPGRVSFIFRMSDEGRLLAIHSHYSLVPNTANN